MYNLNEPGLRKILAVLCFSFLFCNTNAQQYYWAKKANFFGGSRDLTMGFSIGLKAYAGTGRGPTAMNDFWEYDPGNDTWMQKANVPGSARYGALGLSIEDKGYVGLGWTNSGAGLNDYYQYDP